MAPRTEIVTVARLFVSAFTLAALTACVANVPTSSIDDNSQPVSALVDHHAWQVVTADHPWTHESHGPTPACEPRTRIELFDLEEVFEVDTTGCSRQTFMQQTKRAVAAGTTLLIRGFHFNLSAAVPAKGHFAIALQDDIVVDESIKIPSPSRGFERLWTAPRDYDEGAPIFFHIHNHGTNRWVLISVTHDVAPASTDPFAR